MGVDELTVTVVHDFVAPPERVWRLLTDVEAMAGLGPEHVAAAWQDEGRGVGARFTGSNQIGDRAWTVPCTVTAYDEPRAFAWLVGDPAAPSSTWSYALESYDGGTRVTQTFAHGPGFSYVRAYAQQHPEREEAICAGRAEMLRANMAAVLAAAAVSA